MILGTRFLGKTDAVPGVFYVHTKFFHINFIPLCPMKTLLFVGPTQAVAIPESGRSIAAAWTRYLGVIVALVSSVFCFALLSDYSDGYFDWIGLWVAAVVLLLLSFWLIYFGFWGKQLNYATYERASELCSHLGALGPIYQRKVDRYFSRSQSVVEVEAVLVDDADEEEGFHDEVEIPEIQKPSDEKGSLITITAAETTATYIV